MERVDLAKLLVGQRMEPRYREYNWRDIALYALAVGAKAEDLMYTYEKDMKALPSYGTIPYWGAINVRPYQWMPLPASMMANEIIKPTISFLNMDHELIMYRPIDPIKGTFQYQDRITDVYDRGEGKGAVVKTQLDVRDEAGNLVCVNRSTTFFHEAGGGRRPAHAQERCGYPRPGSRLRGGGLYQSRTASALPAHRGHQPDPRGPRLCPQDGAGEFLHAGPVLLRLLLPYGDRGADPRPA
mgnify:CR=1 FL=1